MRPGLGEDLVQESVGFGFVCCLFPWDGSCWGAREFNHPTTAVPRNERDDSNLSVIESSITSRGKGSREQRSKTSASAFCARTGRGKRKTLPAVLTVAGGCGPVSFSEFVTLSSISVDSFFLNVLFSCFFLR